MIFCFSMLNSLEFFRHKCSKILHVIKFGEEKTVIYSSVTSHLFPVYILILANVLLIRLLFSIAAQVHDIEKHCNIEIAAQVSRVASLQNGI